MNDEYYFKADVNLGIYGAHVTIDSNKKGLENFKNVIDNLLSKSTKNFSEENTLMIEELGSYGLTKDIIYDAQVLVKILKICRRKIYNDNEYYLRADVKIEDDGAYVTINANKKGVENLKNLAIGLLDRPIKYLPADIMFMIEEFGGRGLTNDIPAKDHMLVSILKIYRWE